VSAHDGPRPSGSRRRTPPDRRRRTLGQNFLVDRPLIARLVGDLHLDEHHVVVEVGAGTGALTVPMARTGAEIVAVEADPVWADRLHRRLAVAVPDPGRVRVVCADARRWPLPDRPYRVVANIPFGSTTEILAHLLDDPRRGPVRADLIVQREVARKHAATPPTALRTAAWAPWWEFELGTPIGREAFRPRPAVDAAMLVIRRRDPPILPSRLAAGLREALRPAWEAPGDATGEATAGETAVTRPSRGTRRRRG
jgi:23S rRNA (adenine-N6)-dimethyltransferase